jgi:hypothetical protein
MKSLAILFIFAVALFVILGCADKANQNNEPLSKITTDIQGSYSFKLFDQNGELTGQGAFSLISNEELYTGSWQMTNGESGNVFCTVEDGVAYIHLNFSDDLLPREYHLVGNPHDAIFNGQWRYNVEVFHVADFQGTFEAWKNN